MRAVELLRYAALLAAIARDAESVNANVPILSGLTANRLYAAIGMTARELRRSLIVRTRLLPRWTASSGNCSVSAATPSSFRSLQSCATSGVRWRSREQVRRPRRAALRKWLAEQYAAIADPERFFGDLGLRVSDEIARIESELLPQEYFRDEDFMTRVGHRNMARLRPEEIVLHLALPAPGEPDDEDELPDAWIEIGKALISDVEDVVLPRRAAHRPDAAARDYAQARCRQVGEHHFGIRRCDRAGRRGRINRI